jgi:hypothetical protein
MATAYSQDLSSAVEITGTGGENFNLSLEVPENDASATEDAARDALADALAYKDAIGFKYYSGSDSVYSARAFLAAVRFFRANKIFDQEIPFFGGSALSGLLSKKSAEGFFSLISQILSSVVMIYAVILGSGALAAEMKNGTLKLVLLRPVSRNKLAGAKLLATLTIVSAYTLVFLGLAALYGYLAYPSSGSLTLFVFNSRYPFLAEAWLSPFLNVLNSLVTVLTYAVLAFAIGTLTKNRVLGIVLPLAIGVAGELLGMAGLGRFFISDAMNFDKFFSLLAPSYGGSDFFISLPVYAVYIAGLIVASMLVFKRRDAA